MQFTFFRRIIKEDFKKDEQDLVGRIGFIINPCFTQLSSILSRNLTWEDNFSAVVKTITITVDSAGIPLNTTSFSVDLKAQCQNLFVTQAKNLTNVAHYPVSAPFISWTQSGSQIVINHVSGLQANEQYQLRIIITV